MKRGRKKGELFSVESIAMEKLKSGQTFYTSKLDKHITAIATQKGIKVTTERMIAIDSPKHSRIERITKVTIV